MKNNTRPCDPQGHVSDKTGKLSGVKFYEKTKGGSTAPFGNDIIVNDFARLLRWRHGFGPWNEAMLLSILDIVIPRHAQVPTALPLDKAVLRWVHAHMPEIVEKYGTEWVEARRVEVMSWKRGAFPTVDQIARRLQIDRDEVEGAGLRTLRAADNPQRDRKRANRTRNAARKREWRAEGGATPRPQSIAARHERGEFGAVSLKTVRRWIKAGKIDPNVSASDPMSTFRQKQDDSPSVNGRIVDISHTGAAASENQDTLQPTGETMNRRSTFITLKPSALTITHGAGRIDFSALNTASVPIRGKGVTETGAPIFYVPAISGTVVERAGR
ncbi:hypothetical protein [Methylorubrum thiocyanatum]|uniref:hypothetical protein n=1 Tax=Methylorubrum thiocyanatum TaxID=47958 RepID=UPI003F7DAFF1